MSLTKASYSMITGAPVNVLDFGADPTGTADSRSAFQAAIEYAANLNGNIPVTKGAVSTVVVPAGKYKIASTLYIGWADYSSTSAFRYCNLVGEGNAELDYTGSAECLIIGNDTSYGVLPVEIKNLKISRADKAAGTVALRALNAGYCIIENIGVDGFEFGLKIQGSIGAKVDGKMSFINSDKCIRIESYQPDAPVLRMAANNVSVSNYHLGNSAAFGVQIDVGSGVSPSGAGGLIELKNITFESFTDSGIAIQISSNGEVSNTVNQIDTVLIDHCWFENAGALLVDLSNAVAKMQYCWFGPQSSGSPAGVARLNDDYSSVWIDHCYGYNYSTPVVVFGGSATPAIAKERIYINHYRKYSSGTNIVHTDWPVNTLGVRPVAYKKFAIKYNSTYPVGNVDTNALLTLDIAAEAVKMFGTGWTYVDVAFVAQANVLAANTGRVSLRVYNNNLNSFYSMGVIEAGTSTAYTITGTSIQFGTGATSVDWTQMIGVWECNTANGQY